MFGRLSLRKKVLIGAIAVVIVLLVAALLVVFLTKKEDKKAAVRRGAVVSNGKGCATIGKTILERGGAAADAAVATLFCEGVSMPHSMGLGGGFLLVAYDRATGAVEALNARETAPAYASRDMFNGSSDLSQKGGTSVAVPGELLGYWELYNRHGGKLPWKDLVQPTIDLCKNGIPVTKYLEGVFTGKKDLLYADPVLRDIFFNPDTNDTYKEGDVVKRTRLARTLEVIAIEGGTALHNGTLTQGFVSDLNENNSNITADDLLNYKPVWSKAITSELVNGDTLHTIPLPGSGLILAYILNILSGFLDATQPFSVQTYQRIIESFKFGYGKRSLLGDIDGLDDLIANLTSKSYAEEMRKKIFDNVTFDDPEYYGANFSSFDDHGTAHISVLAPNGDAISVTSTINFIFGAGFASDSTGIILNDQMDDFSSPDMPNGFGLPPSPSNFIEPGKRPMSSMSPSVIVDKDGHVSQVIGSAGGSKITTSVAQVIIRHLWFGMGLKESIDYKRVHHQLIPNNIVFEEEFETTEKELIEGLQNIGHNYTFEPADGFSAVTGISTKYGIVGSFDKRRSGTVEYVY